MYLNSRPLGPGCYAGGWVSMVCLKCRCSGHCSSSGICLFHRGCVVMGVPFHTPVFSPFFHLAGSTFFFPVKWGGNYRKVINLFSDMEILQRFGDRCPARNRPLLAVKRSCSRICRRLVPSSCLCPSLSSPPGNGILFNKMEVPGDFLLNSHDLSKWLANWSMLWK